LTTNMIINCLL